MPRGKAKTKGKAKAAAKAKVKAPTLNMVARVRQSNAPGGFTVTEVPNGSR